MKKKSLAVLLAVVGLLATAGTSLAYWASSVSGATGTADGTVEVGTGDAVTTTVNVSDFTESKQLVPAGEVTDALTETDSVSMLFPVSWTSTDADGSGAVGTLTVTQTALTVGGGADTYNLVNVSIPGSVSITADAPTTTDVTIVVTLDLPTNMAQYDSVAGKTIVITFSFTVTLP